MRFISVIESPTRVWSDYLVIDTERQVSMAKCSSQRDADTIAAVLNKTAEENKKTLLLEAGR
jgi:hypothetical protein